VVPSDSRPGGYAQRLDAPRNRTALGLPKDFVLHSLRHTFLTRLGEGGVDAFTRMRIAGRTTITFLRSIVHTSTEAMERAFDQLETLIARVEPESSK